MYIKYIHVEIYKNTQYKYAMSVQILLWTMNLFVSSSNRLKMNETFKSKILYSVDLSLNQEMK